MERVQNGMSKTPGQESLLRGSSAEFGECKYSTETSGGVWRVKRIAPSMFASVSYDGLVRVHKIDNSSIEMSRVFRLHKREALSVCMVGERLLTGSSDGKMGVWNPNRALVSREVNENSPRTGFYSMAHLEGDVVVTGACHKPKNHKGKWEHAIKFWDISSGEFQGDLKGHQGGISAIEKIQAKIIASSSGDGTVRVWNTETLSELTKFEGHKGYVYSAALLGKTILSCGLDRTVKQIDAKRGEQIRAFVDGEDGRAHDSTVYDVNTLGNMVVSASRDGSVKIWDVRQRKKAAMFDPDDGFVYTADFLLDGSVIAGTSGRKNRQAKKENVSGSRSVRAGGGAAAQQKQNRENQNNAHVVYWDIRK